MSLSFDFQKTFVFKSLPSFFANQRLCHGQPSNILNVSLWEDYLTALQKFNEEHLVCFNCDPETPKRHDIIDLITLDIENSVQFLPNYITMQYLFEDEPVAVPFDVEEFYNFYISTDSYAKCTNKLEVENYHEYLIEFAYPEALKLWKAKMSSEKFLRYKKYFNKREIFYQNNLYLRLSINTTTTTDKNANAASPISP